MVILFHVEPLSFGLHTGFFNYVVHFTLLVGVYPPQVGSRAEDSSLINLQQEYDFSVLLFYMFDCNLNVDLKNEHQ